MGMVFIIYDDKANGRLIKLISAENSFSKFARKNSLAWIP